MACKASASVFLALVTAAYGARAERLPLTVTAAIESARLMDNPASASEINPHGAVSVSPDGLRYAARIVRGDVKRNGVWIEVITGRLDSLAVATPRSVIKLFTPGIGSGVDDVGSNHDAFGISSPIRWLDKDYVVFPCSNEAGIRQVVGIDLATGESRFLTRHPTHVLSFDARRDGFIFYNAQAPRPPQSSEALFHEGYAVPSRLDVYSLFHGDVSGINLGDKTFNSEWFVQAGADQPARRIAVAGREVTPENRHRIRLSPNSRYALLNLSVPVIPQRWERYTGTLLEAGLARENRGNPLGRSIHQLHVLDLQEGATRPLWDAPVFHSLYESDWSPDGRYVLVAPVALPLPHADANGRSGKAAAVVDVATGAYSVLPVELEPYGVGSVRWIDQRTVEIVEAEKAAPSVLNFRKTGMGWVRVAARASASAVRIELRQDLNTPPQLVAVDRATLSNHTIVDLDPELRTAHALGFVERISGLLHEGAKWQGLLFYPAKYSRGRAYPLVIQMVYGSGMPVNDAFTLYGDQTVGTGPAQIAPYAAQILAGRGIAVAHINVDAPLSVTAEAEPRARAFEQIARQFAGSGLVDASKVGIAGFSRNGYFVEYTLTHSSFPFAAAIAADNFDPSYLPTTLLDYLIPAAEEVNGGPIFGDGLTAWRRNAPGFNIDNIHTPLWKVAQTGGRFSVLVGWEIFGRLRYLQRPVEFYVMPDAERFGSHNTQNPRQLRAVQEASVDWFDFWLNGHEEVDSQKSSQYERWRKLRRLHESSGESPGT